MRPLSRLVITAAATLALSAPVLAQNFGFESGDLTGWGSAGDVIVTTSVTIDPNTADPTEGKYEAVLFSDGDVTPEQAETLLNLTPGSIQGATSVTLTTGSVIYRDIYLPGDYPLNSNDFNFLAGDYLPFDDTAFVTLTPFDLALPIASISGVGDFGTTGWQNAGFFGIPAGNYRLGFAIFNGLDTLGTSGLALDNFQGYTDAGVGVVPEPGAVATSIILFGGLGLGLVQARRRKK